MLTTVTLTTGPGASLKDRMIGRAVRDLTFVAFDTESTGRHPIISSLVEVAGVKFRGTGEVLESRTQLINPGRTVPEEAIAVHGISNEMVGAKPGFQEVVPAFVQWMKEPDNALSEDSCPNILVAHNAAFDVNFLQVALTRLALPLPTNPVLDTLKLARTYVKETKNHRLKTLVENLGQAKEQNFHRAEADSLHVMHVFLDIIARAGSQCTLGDLVDAAGVTFFSKPYEIVEDHQSVRDTRIHRIGEAMQGGADLHIYYCGHGPKFRQITPLSVLYSRKRFFLNAYCHSAGNERTFRVDRISKLELVKRIHVEC